MPNLVVKFPSLYTKEEMMNSRSVSQWKRIPRFTLRGKINIAIKLHFDNFVYYHISKLKKNPNKYLFNACSFNNIPIYDLLLKLGANDWNIALAGACKFGDRKMIDSIIEKVENEPSTLPPTKFNNVLAYACSNGSIPNIRFIMGKIDGYYRSIDRKELSDKSIRIIEKQYSMGLLFASREGHLDVAKLLVEENNVEITNLIFRTACRKNNMELLNFFIEKVENDPTSYWNSGLIEACCIGNLLVAKLMLEIGANNLVNSFFCACFGGNKDIIQLFIDRGIDSWNSGLNGACSGGHMEIIEQMINYGATNWNDGMNAACSRYHSEHIINYMIQKGANDWEGGLLRASKAGRLTNIKLMVRHGATNLNQALLLHLKNSHRSRLDIVKYLVCHGANNLEEVLKKYGRNRNTLISKYLIDKINTMAKN